MNDHTLQKLTSVFMFPWQPRIHVIEGNGQLVLGLWQRKRVWGGGGDGGGGLAVLNTILVFVAECLDVVWRLVTMGNHGGGGCFAWTGKWKASFVSLKSNWTLVALSTLSVGLQQDLLCLKGKGSLKFQRWSGTPEERVRHTKQGEIRARFAIPKACNKINIIMSCWRSVIVQTCTFGLNHSMCLAVFVQGKALVFLCA